MKNTNRIVDVTFLSSFKSTNESFCSFSSRPALWNLRLKHFTSFVELVMSKRTNRSEDSTCEGISTSGAKPRKLHLHESWSDIWLGNILFIVTMSWEKYRWKKSLKMALNSLWKRPLLWRESCSVAIVIIIYVVIGEFSWKYLKWLKLSDYRCPITANCPITILQITPTQSIVKNWKLLNKKSNLNQL